MPKVVELSRNKGLDSSSDCENGNETSTKEQWSLFMEDSVSSTETYILGLCGTQTFPDYRIGAALSDGTCLIYNVGETLTRFMTLSHDSSPIVGVKFSPNSKNILYTATKFGSITARDLRAKGKIVAELKDSSAEGKLRPLASFDVSCDDRLIAAGTEHVGGDAFILFWDVRYNNSKSGSTNSLLGGYWESLMDDVTSLAFHPTKPNILTSGSTDGMINIFDLSQSSEDLALSYSLNTESSVDRVGWLDDDNIWCTTHTHCLQLWKCEDASPFVQYDRNTIENMLNEDPDTSYLVKIQTPQSHEQPFLLTGSSSIKGENLKAVHVNADGLKICYNFRGNKQIVRDSWYHIKSGCLVTGGENGYINLWKRNETPLLQSSFERKTVTKSNGKVRDRQHRTKPY